MEENLNGKNEGDLGWLGSLKGHRQCHRLIELVLGLPYSTSIVARPTCRYLVSFPLYFYIQLYSPFLVEKKEIHIIESYLLKVANFSYLTCSWHFLWRDTVTPFD